MTDDRVGAIFRGTHPLKGFHEIERDFWGPFVWSTKRFDLQIPNQARHLAMKICYYGSGERLAVRSNGSGNTEIDLYPGWNTYPIDISHLDGDTLEFELSRIIPVPEDTRELGLMIRWISPLDCDQSAALLSLTLRNKVQNQEEYAAGKTVLESFPPKLRINTAVKCSMNPHCVYCDWDRTKADENGSDFTFDREKLEELGAFYTLAEEIVDNSYGEPLLYSHFGDFLDEFDGSLKYFEFGTNGFLLSRSNREKLLGKDAVMYVSADASTPEGFARYRRADFKQLVGNLRELCRERKEHHELPKVVMSYVAMKSNAEEISSFLDLMKDIGVDGVKIIYLDPDPHLQERVIDRDGFSFNYGAELLSWPELEELGQRAKGLAKGKGASLITRMDFGAEEEAGTGPLCSEPWKNIHVLDRGVVTCLFSRTTPLARWSERGDRSVEQFLRDVWNDERYQQMRVDLAEGRLPDLCRKSLSCPLVRKRAVEEWG